jgi:hypothetical protein
VERKSSEKKPETNRVRHEICARTPSRLISFLRQLDGTDGEASNETAETS